MDMVEVLHAIFLKILVMHMILGSSLHLSACLNFAHSMLAQAAENIFTNCPNQMGMMYRTFLWYCAVALFHLLFNPCSDEDELEEHNVSKEIISGFAIDIVLLKYTIMMLDLNKYNFLPNGVNIPCFLVDILIISGYNIGTRLETADCILYTLHILTSIYAINLSIDHLPCSYLVQHFNAASFFFPSSMDSSLASKCSWVVQVAYCNLFITNKISDTSVFYFLFYFLIVIYYFHHKIKIYIAYEDIWTKGINLSISLILSVSLYF
ncbi:hypothetical protein ACJX0J_041393 [Zea mays]